MAQSLQPGDIGVQVGQVFLDKYRVEAILGYGAVGVVAECTHLVLNERVAIKLLRQNVLGDQDTVLRFLREAQAAVKLKSEHVARVTDVGTFETEVPYMVMEFLEGQDLGKLLEQRGTLPARSAVELMVQTAEGLAEAHSFGIVHRDIKPTNLFVTWGSDGNLQIKVLDFGISKSPMGTDLRLTQTQSLLGTPAYMSPEQMRSARLVDSRTDVWSLGTVMYEILEGHLPFEADSFSEMCVKVAVDAPAPMVRTPLPLRPVILRCLAKSPDDRYATMADLGTDLAPFARDPHQAAALVERMHQMLRRSQGYSIRTPLPFDSVTVTKPMRAQPAMAAGSPTATVGRSRRRTIVVGGVVLAALLTGAFALQMSRHDERANPITAAPMQATLPAAEATPRPIEIDVAKPDVELPAKPAATGPIAEPPKRPTGRAVRHPPTGAAAKPATKTPKLSPTPTKPDEAKPKAPACDPFDQMHHC